jgi:hypothetical protein
MLRRPKHSKKKEEGEEENEEEEEEEKDEKVKEEEEEEKKNKEKKNKNEEEEEEEGYDTASLSIWFPVNDITTLPQRVSNQNPMMQHQNLEEQTPQPRSSKTPTKLYVAIYSLINKVSTCSIMYLYIFIIWYHAK